MRSKASTRTSRSRATAHSLLGSRSQCLVDVHARSPVHDQDRNVVRFRSVASRQLISAHAENAASSAVGKSSKRAVQGCTREPQPTLWTEGAPGADEGADQKLRRLQSKVGPGGGCVVDSNCIWCTACRSKITLPLPHQAQKWITHTSHPRHKAAAALAGACQKDTGFGSGGWIEKRKIAWREIARQKKANRASL